MTRYMVQFGRVDVTALMRYIEETTGIKNDIDRAGRVVDFGQTTYDRLTTLPSDSDGHVDSDGNLWVSGSSYQIGTL
jgi:hypothetical protein